MRFVHAGDFHIGATPESGTDWGKERALAVASSLSRTIALCNKEQADLFLIAGDLFNAPPLRKELRDAAYCFSKLEKTRVVLIAGNHDHLSEGCIYSNYQLGDNVFFLNSSEMSSIYFEDINTEVHGFSYYSKEIREPLYDDALALDDGRIHVLLAHGGDSTHIPIKFAKLASSGFDYVALGHIHQPKLFKGTHMAYCGSPEPLDRTDFGSRGCFVGEVTKDKFSIMWHTMGLAKYSLFKLVSDITLTQSALEDCVRAELEAHPNDLFVVNISGSREPDFEIDKDAILSLGRVVEVVDETFPEYDLDKLLTDHDGDIVSYYIQTLTSGEETSEKKKALYYGLNALLSER